MKVSEVSNKVSSYKLLVQSTTEPEFIDITDEVQEHINQSGIDNGLCVVFSRHTTAAITIQENEPLLIEDFCNMLDSVWRKIADLLYENPGDSKIFEKSPTLKSCNSVNTWS